MNPGRYLIEIRHPNGAYAIHTEEVTIGRGETATMTKVLDRPNRFGKRGRIQLALGLATAGAFTWAIVEQNTLSRRGEKASVCNDSEQAQLYRSQANNASIRRAVAITAGALSITGLELFTLLW
jgi:hypothetical protein